MSAPELARGDRLRVTTAGGHLDVGDIVTVDSVDDDGVWVRTPKHDAPVWAADTDVQPPQLDALDVVAAIEAALEVAEVWLVDGTGSVEDRLRVYTLVKELQKRGGRLSEVAAAVEESIAADVPAGTATQVDGQWWLVKRRARRTGFDKQALRSAITATAMRQRPVVDESTGEVVDTRQPALGEVVDTIWSAVDVATGRTKVLREQFDIDLDEYAETTWSTTVEAVDFADLTPEQRGDTE